MVHVAWRASCARTAPVGPNMRYFFLQTCADTFVQMNAGPPGPSAADGSHGSGLAADDIEKEKLFGLVLELTNPEHRETALLELSKRRMRHDPLAPYLCHLSTVEPDLSLCTQLCANR